MTRGLPWAQKRGHIRQKLLVLGDHEVAPCKHMGGQVRVVESGAVEVTDHDIPFPPSHESDKCMVNIASIEDSLDRKDCVHDILVTQDMGMVGAY
jgi:hypothetical protein